MIIVSESKDSLIKYYSANKNVKLYSTAVHPSEAENIAKYLSQVKEDYILFDTVVMDYIDVDKLIYVDNEGNISKFSDTFAKELDYMYAGEIILNRIKNKDKNKEN